MDSNITVTLTADQWKMIKSILKAKSDIPFLNQEYELKLVRVIYRLQEQGVQIALDK